MDVQVGDGIGVKVSEGRTGDAEVSLIDWVDNARVQEERVKLIDKTNKAMLDLQFIAETIIEWENGVNVGR